MMLIKNLIKNKDSSDASGIVKSSILGRSALIKSRSKSSEGHTGKRGQIWGGEGRIV
jgi:hypothetical protein